jgi:hypothetical protein
MDTTTRTAGRWIRVSLVLLASVALTGPAGRSAGSQARISVYGANPTQRDMVTWAANRYRAAGLEGMPPLELHFHTGREDCGGELGLYRLGRVDLCTADSSEPYAKKFLLHEMAHAWTESNVGAAVRQGFMEQQGISSWNDHSVPWKERGFEQTAEVITWGVGEGEVAPLLPDRVDTDTLVRLYDLLTGRRPIIPLA